jgi:hypothetical protein
MQQKAAVIATQTLMVASYTSFMKLAAMMNTTQPGSLHRRALELLRVWRQSTL